MRKTWTDERLDDFSAHTDQRFDAVGRRFDRVDNDIRELRADMNARFDKVDARLDRIDDRFDALHRLLIQTSALIVVALIGLIATQL